MTDKNKKLNYQQKQSLKFVEQADPPFIAKIKEKLGFREHKIEDKVCKTIFYLYLSLWM